MTSYVDYMSVLFGLLVIEKYKKNLLFNLTQKFRNTYSEPC